MHMRKTRYSILLAFGGFFLAASFIVRTALLIISFSKAALTLPAILRIYLEGAFFDLGVVVFLSIAYVIYLLLLPQKWNNSKVNKILTYIGFFMITLLVMFSFFAEFPFWDEFESRFNFIAVDYLVYTFEVINNINQSYPLPWLIGGMLCITALVTWFFYKKNVFANSFSSNTPFSKRIAITLLCLLLMIGYAFVADNSWAEKGKNRYQNELSKAGIYSFFSAFKNNELNYEQFYKMINTSEAFDVTRKMLEEPGASFIAVGNSIRRTITHDSTAVKPNVIMITIESLSADFLNHFGNDKNITPTLDSLADNSIFFSNLYATGTRTVRGMEALSLSIPPTPGSSIVRRPNNNNLCTVGNIFKEQGYDRTFFYGGDGYFDNMNQFFGGNGFDVVDRGRSILVGDAFNAKRTIIPDKEVHFENAWGISDEDIFDAVIKEADAKYKEGKSFYDFVMTTSNHRPFTYPSGKIDLPSGSGRDGAVKYTDYAIAQLLKKSKTKPWFKNTVFIFIADHCASSAGKNAIDIAKYHIPCMIVNMPNSAPRKIETMCSQIDLYPTLFSLLNWKYTSNLYGKDVNAATYVPRIVLGTYQKMAYMKKDSLVILSPQNIVESYLYKKATDEQIPVNQDPALVKEAISQYQTAYYLFKNNGLKQ